MNSIQCDIALRNFKMYEDKLQRLSEIRNIYNKELGYNNTSNHLYRIEIDNRDSFIKKMKDNNVSCGIHYEAMHLNSVYAINNSICPLSEEKSKKTLSIPFHEDLTNDEIMFIIGLIKI